MKLHDLFGNRKSKPGSLFVISGIIPHGKGFEKIFLNLFRYPCSIVSNFHANGFVCLL